jgi:hypothetical protein
MGWAENRKIRSSESLLRFILVSLFQQWLVPEVFSCQKMSKRVLIDSTNLNSVLDNHEPISRKRHNVEKKPVVNMAAIAAQVVKERAMKASRIKCFKPKDKKTRSHPSIPMATIIATKPTPVDLPKKSLIPSTATFHYAPNPPQPIIEDESTLVNDESQCINRSQVTLTTTMSLPWIYCVDDSHFDKDPLLVAEYQSDIYSYLRISEVIYFKKPNGLASSDATSRIYAIPTRIKLEYASSLGQLDGTSPREIPFITRNIIFVCELLGSLFIQKRSFGS